MLKTPLTHRLASKAPGCGRRTVLAATAWAAALLPALAAAQAFPSRPITLVVPYPAGGTTDVLARVMQEPLQKLLGQTVVIDNKPGASAMLGTRLVARAPADGYTLLMPNNALAISPHISKDAGFSAADFTPVTMVSAQPMVLVTHPSLPVKSVRELIAHVKANPKAVNYGTAGPASFGHLATEMFNRQAGIEMTHIPYKGQGPVTQALLSGDVKVMLSTTSSQMNQLVKEGRLNMLGVASPQPTPLAPGAEPLGTQLPGFQAEVWFGIVAPAGTPREIVARLNDAFVKVLQMPDVKARFEASGAAAVPTTPERFAARIAQENESWGRIVREANIKAE